MLVVCVEHQAHQTTADILYWNLHFENIHIETNSPFIIFDLYTHGSVV